MKNFTRLIEGEVKKNNDLKLLIENIEEKLNIGKHSTHQNDEGSNLEELLKKKKKLEYDLEQIIQKNNESLAAIGLLKELVNAARS